MGPARVGSLVVMIVFTSLRTKLAADAYLLYSYSFSVFCGSELNGVDKVPAKIAFNTVARVTATMAVM
jgi:hypothetical protein